MRRFLLPPPLYPADVEPLPPQPGRHRPVPKAFPKWWGALRFLQLWVGTMVFISSLFGVAAIHLAARGDDSGSINHNHNHYYRHHHQQERHHHHHHHHPPHHVAHTIWVLYGLFFAACVPFLYSMATIILSAKYPIGFAKCAPIVLAGDLFMVGLFAKIRCGAGMILRHLRKHGGKGMKAAFTKWAKKGCEGAEKVMRGFVTHSGNSDRWRKEGWKFWHNGVRQADAVKDVKKTKLMGACAVKVVRGVAGVATILFFLSSLVALYIMFTHRGQVKKHLSEVRQSLKEHCRARKMRRCARRAARTTDRGNKCYHGQCAAQSEIYIVEKQAIAGLSSVDVDPTPMSLPVVVDTLPTLPAPYVPGAFPIASAIPPLPQPSQVSSGVATPFEQITPDFSDVDTPPASHFEGEISSTDDEFTHVGYRHVRTPSTSSGSEAGMEVERCHRGS